MNIHLTTDERQQLGNIVEQLHMLRESILWREDAVGSDRDDQHKLDVHITALTDLVNNSVEVK